MIDKRHRPFFFVSLALFISLIVLFVALPVNAQQVIERPMTEGKQKLMELHIRNDGYCSIYRIEIDNVMYIVNTCGGIVVEAPLQVKLGRCND